MCSHWHSIDETTYFFFFALFPSIQQWKSFLFSLHQIKLYLDSFKVILLASFFLHIFLYHSWLIPSSYTICMQQPFSLFILSQYFLMAWYIHTYRETEWKRQKSSLIICILYNILSLPLIEAIILYFFLLFYGPSISASYLLYCSFMGCKLSWWWQWLGIVFLWLKLHVIGSFEVWFLKKFKITNFRIWI